MHINEENQDMLDATITDSDMDMDMDMNMDRPYTEEQVEAIQAEEFNVDNLAKEIERQAEEQAQAKLDEANFSIAESELRKLKTMSNTDQNGCRKNVKDVVMFGDDLFKLMSKASSEDEGWMKSTKGMDTGKGCVVQVTTQQRNQDGSYSIAEALTYVSGVTLTEQRNEEGEITGRRLKGVR